jgi:hypothetical protein
MMLVGLLLLLLLLLLLCCSCCVLRWAGSSVTVRTLS